MPVALGTVVSLSAPGVVFNYPGMGLAFYNAALRVDYQVLLGFTLFGRVRHN